MVLIHSATIWLSFSAFLLFGVLRLPTFMRRAAMTLLCGELLALLVVSYAPRGSIGHDAAWALAGQDVPGLVVLLYAIALAFGVRAHRRAASIRQAAPSITTRSR